MKKIDLKLDKQNAQSLLLKTDFKNSARDLDRESHLISQLIHNSSNYEQLMWVLFQEPKATCMLEITSLLQEITILEPQLAWSCLMKQKKYDKEYKDRHHRSKYILATQ
jgi:hypothetical protein